MKQSNSRSTAAERARIRRLRAMYRKRMLIVGVVFFIIGIVAGALVHSWFAGRHNTDLLGDRSQALQPSSAPVEEQMNPFEGDLDDTDGNAGFGVDIEPTAVPTEAPTEAPTPEPTVEPTKKPTISIPVTAEPVAEEPEAAPAEGEAAVEGAEGEAAQAAPAEGETAVEGAPAVETAQAAPAEGESLPMIAPENEGEAQPETQAAPAEGEAAPAEGEGEQAVAEQPEEAVEATPEPTAEPAPQEEEPYDGPKVVAVVPFGESYTYTTQVKMDGTARLEADTDPYETLKFTQTMKEYLRPSDFANRYSTEYRLTGDEAGAGFELVLNDYVGTSAIIPQRVIDVGFCSATGETVERGYQLMDKAIGGNYDVTVESNAAKTLFKRYAYSNVGEEMAYLVVTTYNDGRQQIILFELEGEEPPEPEIVYPIMQKGLKSDDVRNMQERLIELGYLKGKADGDFGKGTEAAVKKAQEDFGMEANGVADNDFQQRLYAGMASKPIPTTMRTPEPTTVPES